MLDLLLTHLQQCLDVLGKAGPVAGGEKIEHELGEPVDVLRGRVARRNALSEGGYALASLNVIVLNAQTLGTGDGVRRTRLHTQTHTSQTEDSKAQHTLHRLNLVVAAACALSRGIERDEDVPSVVGAAQFGRLGFVLFDDVEGALSLAPIVRRCPWALQTDMALPLAAEEDVFWHVQTMRVERGGARLALDPGLLVAAHVAVFQ
mmetsp:Transcript_45481/g.98512  ORF Transcript_45481/g.98512 Transcript_45481/m.98512 type:complete len:205 (+) Transcript_45481:334-948(+)